MVQRMICTVYSRTYDNYGLNEAQTIFIIVLLMFILLLDYLWFANFSAVSIAQSFKRMLIDPYYSYSVICQVANYTKNLLAPQSTRDPSIAILRSYINMI